MNRRTYLAVGSSVAVAGCLGYFEDDETEAPESNAETQSTGDMESESSADESEPEADEPQSDPEPDPEEQTDDRQQSTDEIEFQRSLETAEQQYRRALQEYAPEGSDQTLLDVFPSTEIEYNNAREYLETASDILWQETRELATTAQQEATVREYRTYDELIPDLARIQRYIYLVYTRIEPVSAEPTYSRRPSQLASLKADYEALGEELAEKELYMDEIQTKYDQQAWQIELVDRMFTGLVNIGGPQQRNSRSQTELQLARNEFRTVTEQLEDPTSAPPEDRTDQEFLKLATEWFELADDTLREGST